MKAVAGPALDGGSPRRAEELLAFAEETVGRALEAGADEAEAYVESTVGTTLRSHARKLEWLRSADSAGIGIRVVAGQRLGYGYGSDLSSEGIGLLVELALANAAVTDSDPLLELPEPSAEEVPALELGDPDLAAATADDKLARLGQAEAAAFGRSAVESISIAQYGDERKEVAIANSHGVAGSYATTFVYLMLEAIAQRDGDVQAGQGFVHARTFRDLPAASAGEEAAERAETQLGAVPAPTTAATVVLSPLAAAQLLGQMSRLFSGEAALRDRTILAPLLGRRVAHPAVTLLDDPLAPDGPGSRPFDGEGVRSRQTTLVEDGVLTGFAHNHWTGRRSGGGSTGNARRSSYRASPEIGFSNFVVRGETKPAAELLDLAGGGIYVDELQGLHNVSALTGRFSVGFVGRLIEGGELTQPIRDGTLAAEFLQLLDGIAAVGDDFRFLPGSPAVGAPSILVDELSVAGG